MGNSAPIFRILFVLALCAVLPGAVCRGAEREQATAFWLQGRIVAAVPPLPNEGYIQVAERVLADPSRFREIEQFNAARPVRMGRNVRVPLALLKAEFRGRLLRALYPDDELTERGWAHNVTDPLESLIQLTLAYTGSKNRFLELAHFNGIKDPDRLRRGDVVTIPLGWIPKELGLRPVAVRAPLGLRHEARDGRSFATYQLRPNETLYSVLLRFTERERAEEVRRMSGLLLRLNQLRDERSVPTNRPLDIPIEWISPEFLLAPGGAPRPPPPVAKRLPAAGGGPLHVILDPGHGGVDPGAVYGGRKSGGRVYEHEVVYDIALRLAEILVQRSAKVHLTVLDNAQRLPVVELSTARLGKERVRVTPPYIISDTDVGVNMRVFLVEALYRRLTLAGVAPDNIVLISIHGDALAPTLRGAMVYYPDHRLRTREFRPRGRVYRIRQEAVPAAIHFDVAGGRDIESSSLAFGQAVMAAFKRKGLRVGGRRPVRSYYYREGERTLPAVLRYSRVPVSVLVEVANLNNPADLKAIRDPRTRQGIAAALADAVRQYRREQAAVALGGKSG